MQWLNKHTWFTLLKKGGGGGHTWFAKFSCSRNGDIMRESKVAALNAKMAAEPQSEVDHGRQIFLIVSVIFQ